MSIPVQVFREKYTRRDKILKDRSIYILTLNAIVPTDSYLITASSTQLPNIYNDVIKIIKTLKENKAYECEFISRELENNVKKLEKLKDESREEKIFPKINDDYVIPASTLKGAIRSRIEYKLAQKDNKSPSCYIVEENFYPQFAKNFYPQFAINHIKFWGNDVVISKPSCNISRNDYVCIVCDIFGCPSLSSLVNFSDAYMINGHIEKLNDLNYEAASPGSTFEFKVTCFNFDNIRLGLLLLGLEIYNQSPIIIGRFKYQYNKKLGKLYKNKYSIGLLKFELKKVIDHKGTECNTNEIISKCKMALESNESLNKYIRWERGVIES